MNQPDQASQFWIDQGPGASDIGRGHQEMWEHARESGGQEQTFEDDDIHQAVTAAADEVKNRAGDREDWDGSREHREALSEAYPQGDLSNYVLNKLGWHRAFQENPAAAREQYVRAWSRQSPFHPKVAPKVKEEAPKDWLESGKAEWQADKDARDGYRQAARNRADDEAFTTTAKLRQLVKERTGLSFSDFLTKCRQIDEASLNDPTGIANRFAVFSGMPATEREAGEQMNAAQWERHYAEQKRAVAENVTSQMGVDALSPQIQERMVDFINDAYKGRPDLAQNIAAWPELLRHAEAAARNELRLEKEHLANTTIDEFRSDPANKYYAKLETEIANLLTTGQVQRTGDMRADLKAAYDMAVRRNPEIAADKARRASRSVTGAPSPGARSANRGSHNSVEQDVYAAYHSRTI